MAGFIFVSLPDLLWVFLKDQKSKLFPTSYSLLTFIFFQYLITHFNIFVGLFFNHLKVSSENAFFPLSFLASSIRRHRLGGKSCSLSTFLLSL